MLLVVFFLLVEFLLTCDNICEQAPSTRLSKFDSYKVYCKFFLQVVHISRLLSKFQFQKLVYKAKEAQLKDVLFHVLELLLVLNFSKGM